VLLNIRYKPAEKNEITELIPFMVKKFSQIDNSSLDGACSRWVMGQLSRMALGNMNLTELSEKVGEQLK
jgi:hypothetical protein